jgi:glycosyltransferase involved in cell wall biosynthesis
VGDGMVNSNNDLQKLIKLNGLENLIICLGPQEDITDTYNVIDVHVLSSGSESFGNVTAEALSCSIPCIMTDVGEAHKILNDIGWIVPPRNFIKLSDAILAVYNEYKNSEKWNLLKFSCRERIIANYSIDKMIKSYNSTWMIEK